MKSTIRLFKLLPIEVNGKKEPSKQLLEETIKRGFIFSSEVIANYSEKELLDLTQDIGLTPEQLNSSFHKSWVKIKEASIEQLFLEQIIHYITTYGYEKLGIYDKDSVYIPNEQLEILELKDINLIIIKGYTKEELKEKLLKLLDGIALSEDTIKDVIDIALFVGLNEKEIGTIKNREVKVAMYDYLNLVPENPIEFLRYIIFKSTGKTLLIKSPEVIEEIKKGNHIGITRLFEQYDLSKLAQIFYRFKPVFLAFRTNRKLKIIINKIRRLAVKNHKPLLENYLDSITAKIKQGKKIDNEKLEEELSKVNIFRKIRLAYALKFRTKDSQSILYRIRNGKGYAKEFEFNGEVESTLDIVLKSITDSLDLRDKKIYIPNYMNYALPATEKQFTGYFPSGSYISIPNDMIFGIHWNNVKSNRIDLDLSLIDKNGGKIGWDSSYRTEDRKILFSGDMTNAQNGATELFYVGKQLKTYAIMLVNYYNYDSDVDVPFDIIVAKEKPSDFNKNYMVNPNNILSVANSKISQKQKILGLLITTTTGCRFYFTETNVGKSITSSDSEFVKNTRQFLFDYYEDTINLKDILEKAGVKFTDKEECDIDLSPENLEKDTILNLLKW